MSRVSLQSDIDRFAERIFEGPERIVDPEGVHHEFNQGLHGIKADFDLIDRGRVLYDHWIRVNARFHRSLYRPSLLGNSVLIGVANGTNDVAHDTAEVLGIEDRALATEKDDSKKPVLTDQAVDQLEELDPEIVIINEDVLTRGTNTISVVGSVHAHRNPSLGRIEVVGTLQRGIPERLVENGVVYHSLITRLQRDFTAEQCAADPQGFCARGWELVPHGV